MEPLLDAAPSCAVYETAPRAGAQRQNGARSETCTRHFRITSAALRYLSLSGKMEQVTSDALATSALATPRSTVELHLLNGRHVRS